MNKRIIMLMAAALALLSASGQVEFTNYGNYKPIEIHLSDNQTSLNKVYVLYDTDGVGMTYSSTTGEPANWQTYDFSSGRQVIEEIPGIRWDGFKTTLDQVKSDIGYIISDGAGTHYYWVINYADYYMKLNDIFVDNEDPCDLITLTIDGNAGPIPYYTLNGSRQMLDRELRLAYYTQKCDSITHQWEDVEVVDTLAALDKNGYKLAPPLCDTYFTLSGDYFLREWKIDTVAKESNTFNFQAVDFTTTADQQPPPENESEEDVLGGSAPFHIVFTGYPSAAVDWTEWKLATDKDFVNVEQYYNNQNEVDITFDKTGTYYMRYKVVNTESSCEAEKTYTITVGSSELKERPNVFILSEGGTNKWRVYSSSLIEFHCWIFNRWGNLVYEFTDPNDGWDGTYKGRQVDTGVFYYVITALGSDGHKYNERGDITVLRYKKGVTNNPGSETGGVDIPGEN